MADILENDGDGEDEDDGEGVVSWTEIREEERVRRLSLGASRRQFEWVVCPEQTKARRVSIPDHFHHEYLEHRSS